MNSWEKELKRNELIREIGELEEELEDVKVFINHFEGFPEMVRDGFEKMEKIQKKIRLLRKFLKRYRKRYFIDHKGRYFRS